MEFGSIMNKQRFFAPKVGTTLTLLLLFVTGASQAASKIYKTIDAEGNVVYSDVAPSQQESDAELQVEELNTFANPAPVEPAEALPVVVLEDDEDPEALPQAPEYTNLRVISPSGDEGVRANDGNIALKAAIEPGLFRTHQLRFFLDGNPVGTVRGSSMPLSNVDRGTHQAKVAVIDDSGNVLKESEVVTFHVLRYFKPPASRGGS
ncbi:MAG: DUF4124 domain-containing protein [Pseudomonadales bacterium]